MIRVVLIDDQEMVRSGLARLLSLAGGIDVVGEYADGDELEAAVNRHKPDVVLLDVRMKRVDGVTALRQLRERSDEPPVLILTTFDDDEILWDTITAGTSGFVLKDAGADELVRAVRAVAGGGAWLDPSVTSRVLDRHRRRGGDSGAGRRIASQLSERELDVLRLVAKAATNTEIAEQLFIGEGTVKTHISSIYAKLGARDRSAAIVFAYENGLVSPD